MVDRPFRERFPGHYRPTEEEFEELWRDGTFVFDANVLLNLYRYSPSTRDELFRVLERIDQRIWIPHQAALEFEENRLSVIQRQREIFLQFEAELESTKSRLLSQAQRLRRHSVLDAGELEQHVSDGLQALEEHLQNRKDGASELFSETGGLITHDVIRERLVTVIGPRVGGPFSDSQLNDAYREGQERYADEIPPGFLDAAKDEPRMYGDLILWKQALAKAGEADHGIVLVSDDNKEDWWWRHKGLTLGPRPELVAEMREVAGVAFYMYSSVRFLELARQYLDQEVSDEALSEAERVRSHVALEAEPAASGRLYSPDELHEMQLSGFSGPAVSRIVGITYRQLDYWVRTELIHPSLAEAEGSGTKRLFSRRDLLEVLLIRRLLDNGLSLQRVRQGIIGVEGLRDEDLARSTVALTGQGARVFESPAEVLAMLERGEGISAISIASIDRELDERLAALTYHEDSE